MAARARQVFVQCLYNPPVAEAAGPLRIGEFARRVGVTPELLRAWESRYGLTRPVRSQGGFRLAGPGATNEFCVRLGARRLDGDLVAAADEVARA